MGDTQRNFVVASGTGGRMRSSGKDDVWAHFRPRRPVRSVYGFAVAFWGRAVAREVANLNLSAVEVGSCHTAVYLLGTRSTCAGKTSAASGCQLCSRGTPPVPSKTGLSDPSRSHRPAANAP